MKSWQQINQELVELESTMTEEQLDAVEINEEKKRNRIALENEY